MSNREERLEAAAELYDGAAEQLELATRHCRTAGRHFSDGDVPRGAAHAWAARGHLLAAEELLDEQARTHSRRSKLERVDRSAQTDAREP